MKLRQIILSAAALLIAAGIAGQAAAQEKKEEKDQILKMSQVPQKVQQTINTYATANEIKKITLGDADGTPAYEFEIEKAGRKSEVSITRDGKMLSTEEDMPPSEFTEAARKTINSQATGGKILSTKKVLEDGKTSFAAVIEKGGKQREITVAADGKVVDTEIIKH